MGKVILFLNGHHGVWKVPVHVEMHPEISNSLFKPSAPFLQYYITLSFHVCTPTFAKPMNGTSAFLVPVIDYLTVRARLFKAIIAG